MSDCARARRDGQEAIIDKVKKEVSQWGLRTNILRQTPLGFTFQPVVTIIAQKVIRVGEKRHFLSDSKKREFW